jgi:hypothetical protein
MSSGSVFTDLGNIPHCTAKKGLTEKCSRPRSAIARFSALVPQNVADPSSCVMVTSKGEHGYANPGTTPLSQPPIMVRPCSAPCPRSPPSTPPGHSTCCTRKNGTFSVRCEQSESDNEDVPPGRSRVSSTISEAPNPRRAFLSAMSSFNKESLPMLGFTGRISGYYNPFFSSTLTPKAKQFATINCHALGTVCGVPGEEGSAAFHKRKSADLKYLREISRYKLSAFPAAERHTFFKFRVDQPSP